MKRPSLIIVVYEDLLILSIFPIIEALFRIK